MLQRRTCFSDANAVENVIATGSARKGVPVVSRASFDAQERGEPVGGVVGYSVRLDTRACAATRLLYCTTGALLGLVRCVAMCTLPAEEPSRLRLCMLHSMMSQWLKSPGTIVQKG